MIPLLHFQFRSPQNARDNSGIRAFLHSLNTALDRACALLDWLKPTFCSSGLAESAIDADAQFVAVLGW